MSTAAADDLASLIEPVARALLGDPNPKLSSKKELRWGNRGSFCVQLEKGAWFDNELQQGGGVLDLIERETGLRGPERWDWLREHGFISGERAKANGGGAADGTTKKANGQAGPLGVEVARFRYTDEFERHLFDVLLGELERRTKSKSRHAHDCAWGLGTLQSRASLRTRSRMRKRCPVEKACLSRNAGS